MERIIQGLLNTTGGAVHTAVGVGQWAAIPKMEKTNFEVILDSSGGSATVEIHGSNYGGVPGEGSRLMTFTVSGVNDRISETKPDPAYFYMCAKVTAISGGANVRVVVGG